MKLAILGTDGAHAKDFCRYASENSSVELVGIWGEDAAETASLSHAHHCQIAPPEELADAADAAAILFRDGSKHIQYAEAFARRGIPLFVDKPFTADVGEAERLIGLCEANNCPFTGGSLVKCARELSRLKEIYENASDEITSGYFSFNVQMDSRYSGLHFYSHHLIEQMLTVFGCGVRSISAQVTGGKLTAVASYDSFPVVMNFAVCYDAYYAGLFGTTCDEMVKVDISACGERQFAEFLTMCQTGIMPYPGMFFQTAVKVSCALQRSIQERREILIK